MAFIDEIAAYVVKYAPQYGIKVYSPIIAQSILESASGTSELAKNAHNYFGLKYRATDVLVHLAHILKLVLSSQQMVNILLLL